jgi:tetratricopeptide (TPR) repeat protein
VKKLFSPYFSNVIGTGISANFDSCAFVSAHQALADAFMAMGNKEIARKYYERSLDLNPQNEYVQDRLENLEP